MADRARRRRGLRARLGRLFALQLAVIGTATLIGIYITQLVVEDLLTRQALASEAEHYWQLRDADPRQPLPHTANLRGYLAELPSPGAAAGSRLPPVLRGEQPGFRRVHMADGGQLVHVSDRGGARLYLVFEAEQVSDLAFYFGTVPLSIVLLLIYGLLFVAYRWSQAALSPIVGLARQLEAIDLDRMGSFELDFDALRENADAEVATLVDALEQFADRLTAAIERERVFTRDAGHELRTPLAVFKGSLDLLERERDRPAHDREALARMRRTADGMESLLGTLLLLARQEIEEGDGEATPVQPIVQAEIRALEETARRRGNRLQLHGDGQLTVQAPAPVVRIVVGNLLRNAVTYTENGHVEVTLLADGLRVEDDGIGMSREELANMFEPFYRAEGSRGEAKGHGLGLSIVRRLSRKHGWTIKARSQPGQGTSVELRFRAD